MQKYVSLNSNSVLFCSVLFCSVLFCSVRISCVLKSSKISTDYPLKKISHNFLTTKKAGSLCLF